MQAAARSLSHFKFNNRRCAGLFWALFCGLTFFSDLLHFGTALLKGLYAVADHRNDNDELIAEVLKSVFSWWVKASTCHNKTSGAKEKDEGRVRAKEVEECAYAFFAREVCDAKVTYETAPTKPATTQAPTVVDEATIISPEIATNAPNAGENSASDRPHRQTTKKSNQ